MARRRGRAGLHARAREWPGTTIVFEIAGAGDQTEVRFTHVGLVPQLECFESCSGAWGHYVGDSLRAFITG